MKLHEYQSINLLKKYGVPVPNGEVAHDPRRAKEIAGSFIEGAVVKAQVLMGGRGKAGGVKIVKNAEEAFIETEKMIGKTLTSVQNPAGMVVEKVLVVECLDITEQYYLSVLVDRVKSQIVVMISKDGGMDIEEIVEENPQSIIKLYIDPAYGICDYEIRRAIVQAGLPTNVHPQITSIIKSLLKAFKEEDTELIEINPLALLSDGRVIAGDAKIIIEDNAMFRHPEHQSTLAEDSEDPIEALAAEKGIAYVRLGGNIGILGNGAGLVMCSIDEINAAGGKPANFLDVGGGAKAERVKTCVEIILKDPNVKGLLINIFGGITRCDEVAKGILDAFNQLDLTIPVVVRIEGTAAEEGRALLENTNVISATTMQKAAHKIVGLVNV